MLFSKTRRGKGLNVRKVVYISVITVIVVVLIYWLLGDEEISLGEGEPISIEDYEMFEDELMDDFPTNHKNTYRIPRIIHQTWKNVRVPSQFIDNIRSFIKHNPSYLYYFWTDDSARMLIEEKHPHLLETFDNYAEPVRRADMIRYVVLYEFGGVYADLDTQCLRPLDHVLGKYACVVSPEPFEHASLIYNTDLIVTNSIMFCKAQHPFLKTLMTNLPAFSHFSQDIDASGPNYMTYYYKQFRKHLMDKRQLPEDHNEFIYQASSQFFQNEIDLVRVDQFKRTCRKFSTLNTIQKRGCITLKRMGLKRKHNELTFTKHSFYHTGYKIVKESNIPIFDIVKHAKEYHTEN